MNTDFLTPSQKKFLDFVKGKHGDQKRKYTGHPYWYHLVNVAKILYDNGNTVLIEIALGHDLLEDTDCTMQDIFLKLKEIGHEDSSCGFVLNGICALTDVYTKEAFPELNRKKRKEQEAMRLSLIQPEYQTVKYADLIDNGRDIIANDPKGFARKYIEEKKEILSLMYQGNASLLIKANQIVYNFEMNKNVKSN